MVLEASRRQHQLQQRLAASAVLLARGAWRLLDRHALDATVPRLLNRLRPEVETLQRQAAEAGAAYVPAALAEQGLDVEPAGQVDPDRLAGVAADGRPLGSLLEQPVVRVRVLSSGGVPVDEAMRRGRSGLERIVATQVADAGRVASGVAVAATPRVGYVRMLNLPSCSRCAVLAGRFYRYNAGFQRHPLCDCIHVPTSEDAAGDLRTDPRAYFDSLSEVDQNRVFSRAGAEAIRDGADLSQVVNARRGMHPADGRLLTRESTTRAGVAQPGRPMPEQIYRDATSREDAVTLLRRHGYIR